MKKLKCTIGISIIFIMLFSVLSTSILATDTRPHEDPDENVEYTNMLGLATNKFEFNAQQFLHIYSLNSSTPSTSEYLNNKVLKYRQNLNDGTLVPINTYSGTENPATETAELLESSVTWNDGVINASDASMLLAISVHHPVTTQEDKDENLNNWSYFINMLKYSLADELDIDRDDVVVTVNVAMKAIPEYGIEANSYSVNTTDLFSNAIYEKMNEIVSANETINEELGISHSNWVHHLISISATTRENGDWKLVLGTDNNFYFLQTSAPEYITTATEFKTELTYLAMVGTVDVGYTMDNGTCLPKYDTNNVKKDADVTAIIKSKNDLEILTVDGEAVGADKTTPNEDGWYYTTAGSKKEVAKLYKFADYDNLNDNGTVVYDSTKASNNYRGKVKVTLGSIEVDGEQLESEEQISIQWPFRIIEDVQDPKEIKEDTTKVTRTVTTNLPIDKTKLPDGWEFTDTELGKSQHQVSKVYTRTNGDVTETPTFTRNGGKDTVTVDVKVKWTEKNPTVLPQTGAFTVVLSIAILGIVVFAVTRYRKLKK